MKVPMLAKTLLVLAPLMLQQNALAGNAVQGRVIAGGTPLSGAEVSLWRAAGTGSGKVSTITADRNGEFTLDQPPAGEESVYYLVARGPDPGTVLMANLGDRHYARVTINELTTVASVWTAAQFLDGERMTGNALGLRIAAGNVPNLVNLETGGLGPVVQDPLNSSQTTTMAKLNTLGNILASCAAKPKRSCARLFQIATPPGGSEPSDTLQAAQNIARYPWHNADQLFALFDQQYPRPATTIWRDVPHIPYLNYAPSAWTLSLVYAGGGLNSLGGIAVDGEGNLWADDNFLVGAQSTLFASYGGGLSKLAPDGTPLSPMTTGFRGGGIDGPGFGIAVAADDKVWATSLAGKNIVVFDRVTGEPLSPATGYNFNGRLGQMQGIIVTPKGDVWALDNQNSQIVYLPRGDASRGRILGSNGDPAPKLKAPFHLAVDQEDRIWVTNSGARTVTRFPADDPGSAEEFEVGFAPRAIAIDSRGNAWVANTVGHARTREKVSLLETALKARAEKALGSGSPDDIAAREWISLFETLQQYPGGDVSMIRPDGTVLGPFDGDKSLIGPWGIAVDGNDNIWVANATGRSIAQLCGVRTERCPPGHKTGDAITPPEGYIGGLQIITDLEVDPAGNMWVANNWQLPERAGFKETPPEAISTRFGGNGAVIFFGVAKPVRTPLIGPVQGW